MSTSIPNWYSNLDELTFSRYIFSWHYAFHWADGTPIRIYPSDEKPWHFKVFNLATQKIVSECCSVDDLPSIVESATRPMRVQNWDMDYLVEAVIRRLRRDESH